MRKFVYSLIAALLITGFSLPLASSAHEPEPLSPTGENQSAENKEHEVEHLHIEIEKVFEKNSEILIPPVVLRMGQPRDPNIYVLPTIQSEEGLVVSLETSDYVILEQVGNRGKDKESTLDPYRHAAIPIDSLNISTATPADEFIEGARFLGLGLAATAVGLSAVTGINTVRSRRRKLRYLNSSGQ